MHEIIKSDGKDIFYVNYFYFIVSGEPNKHIVMISKGSYDTEDWSNHAKNSTLTSQE